jgi:putative flavoprotein involved in K+ transport
MNDRFETVVIGGGQAGLAAAYYLSKLKQSYVVVDANRHIGDAWRMRWDSLRLFTPASIDHLPGMAFPAPGSHLPTKDEMADYLEAYTLKFDLPIRLRTKVDQLKREDDRFVMGAGNQSIEAANVIVATGAHQLPRVPDFANQLDPGINQLHSTAYRNPGELQPGPLLVVGVGNSGAEIARELGPNHPTWLAGRAVGYIGTGSGPLAHIGYQLGSRAFALLGSLNSDTWLGRRLINRLRERTGGDPVIGMGPEDLAKSGVQRRPRVTGVEDGLPRFDDGSVLDVKTVIWCTGFRRDFQWIKASPAHHRGVGGEPGLYFVGLRYQSTILSGLVAGAAGDAKYVVEHLAARRPTFRKRADRSAVR